MRHALVAVFLTLCFLGAGGAPAVVTDGLVATVHAQPEIEIKIGEDPWYQQPVWIAIAIIGVILLVVLVVMATRGGGTKI